MDAETSHLIDVRDALAFLHRMMIELAGDSNISFEGDLSRFHPPDNCVIGNQETATLKRQTLVPTQDFVVLRLTPDSVEPIFQQVKNSGLKRAIIHIQIERNGTVALGAYDNLHRECVVTGPGLDSSVLTELKQEHIIRSFEVTTPKSHST